MKKRGLSDVITVALIILLAISAVVIVWTFVRSALEDVGEQVTASCVSIDVKPTKCGTDGSPVDYSPVVIRYSSGKGDITVDKLVYTSKAQGTTEIIDSGIDCDITTPTVDDIILKPGEAKACTVDSPPSTGDEVGVIIKVGDTVCPESAVKVDCV